MRVFLVTHGINDLHCGERGVGRKQITQAADFLKDKKLGLDLSKTALLASQSTRDAIPISAEIMGQVLGLRGATEVNWPTDDTGESTLQELQKFAATHPELENIIWVSHAVEIENLLDQFGLHAITGNGSVYCIDLATGKAEHLFEPTFEPMARDRHRQA